MGRPWRWVAVTVAAAVVVALALSWRPTQHDLVVVHPDATQDYLPGVAADVYLPPAATAHPPVVVLVPGGGWLSADRSGLGPLARSLADHGILAVDVTYRVGKGARFPVPVADIVCAIDFAASRARLAGFTPGPMIVLGHSAGAQLAALAALAPSHFRRDCPYPAAQVAGLVGLSGPYDVSQVGDLAYPLFGMLPGDGPAVWREGNPLSWLAVAPDAIPLAVLLAHGTADELVPVRMSQDFARALESAGHPVQLVLVPGASHGSTYEATVIAWIGGLGAAAAP